MNFYIKEKVIYKKLFLFLLICSVWLTVSLFLVFRFDAPLNFSHTAVIVTSIILLLIFRENISLRKPHVFLIVFFVMLLFLSIIKFLFIDNETLMHGHWNWINGVKVRAYIKLNSYFLFFKECFHLSFMILTLFVSSIVIKKSQITLENFKYILQKYLYYVVLFYLIVYGIFFYYEDIIAIFGTNRYNGFRSFAAVKNQNFFKIFPYRLGITHTEPSFSGLYVLIFSPLIFLKSKYKNRLIILVPLFFVFNASKYVLAVTIIICLIWSLFKLYKISKENRHQILKYLMLFFSLIITVLYYHYNEKIIEVLNDYSGYSRLFSMFSGLLFFSKNLFTGIGIGQFPIQFVENFEGTHYLEKILIISPSAQNMFVSGLAEFGFIYISFIIFVFCFLYKIYYRDIILFYCSLILIFNFHASPGNGFNMIYYWVLLIFFSFYAWDTKKN